MHKLSKSFILRNLGAHIRAFSRYNPELAQLYFFFLRRIPSHTPRLYLLLSSSLFNNSAFFPVFHAFQGPFRSSPWIFASWVSNFNVSSTFSWILSFFIVPYFCVALLKRDISPCLTRTLPILDLESKYSILWFTPLWPQHSFKNL